MPIEDRDATYAEPLIKEGADIVGLRKGDVEYFENRDLDKALWYYKRVAEIDNTGDATSVLLCAQANYNAAMVFADKKRFQDARGYISECLYLLQSFGNAHNPLYNAALTLRNQSHRMLNSFKKSSIHISLRQKDIDSIFPIEKDKRMINKGE